MKSNGSHKKPSRSPRPPVNDSRQHTVLDEQDEARHEENEQLKRRVAELEQQVARLTRERNAARGVGMPPVLEDTTCLCWLKSFLQHIPAALFVKDLDGTLLLVNQHFTEWVGKSEATLVGCNQTSIFPAALVARWQAEDQHVIDSGDVYEFEAVSELRAPPCTFRIIKFPIYNDTREMCAIGGVVLDVSERVRAEQAERDVRQSLSVLQTIIESVSEALIVLDRDKNIVLANSKFEHLWNLPPEWRTTDDPRERFGLAMQQMRDPQRFYTHLASLEQRARTEEFHLVELKDGRMLEHYSTPYHVDGKVAGWLASFRDITHHIRMERELRTAQAQLEVRVQQRTAQLRQANYALQRQIAERSEAEAALHEERARFRWVVEQSEDGFLIVDEGDHLHYANRQARSFFNLPPAPAQTDYELARSAETFLALANATYDCHPAEAWQSWHTSSQSSTGEHEHGESPVRYLVRPETTHAQALWLQVDTFALPDRVHRDHTLVRLRDVTEDVTRQRQMWTFHALISHKLNTPLASMINSLYLLTTNQHMAGETKEFADIALTSARRLHIQLQRIRHFLSASSLAQPGFRCPLALVPALIEEVQSELDLPSVTWYGFEHLDPETHLVLSKLAMALLLRQVLDNARKFHPTHTPGIEVRLTRCNDTSIVLQVSDDGIGLNPAQLHQVWLPYYQAEKDFSGQVDGMGLGLAIVATLLWNVGGGYRIFNRTPPPGAVIELTVPLAPPD